MLTLKPIPCRQDNYIWILHDTRYAWVIDPSLAAPVRDYIAQHGLILIDILITHHHYDHVEGIDELLPLLKGHVIGASQRIPQLTDILPSPAKFKLNHSEIDVELISTFGHTYDHVSYYLPNALPQPLLFCGDTIFSAGCGRLFDGTIEQLFDTFQRLMQLPDNTLIACAHEYTLSNLEYALAIDPGSEPTQNYNNQVKYARARDQPSLPSHLALEKSINPYMRCVAFESEWISHLTEFAVRRGVSEVSIQTPFDAFKLCRVLKNTF